VVDVVAVGRPLARVVGLEVDLDPLHGSDDHGVLAGSAGGQGKGVAVDVHGVEHHRHVLEGQPEPAEVSFDVDHGLYGSEDLASVPDAARKLSRGCGNPVEFAGVTAGEVVVDVGCGGGIDVILAALLVGDRGSVTGVDMAPEMIERARQAVIQAGVAERTSFVVADMAHTGFPDPSVDVIISNCVINLDPEKEAVYRYREIVRVLRPGGRIAICDIVLSEPIDSALSARFRAS